MTGRPIKRSLYIVSPVKDYCHRLQDSLRCENCMSLNAAASTTIYSAFLFLSMRALRILISITSEFLASPRLIVFTHLDGFFFFFFFAKIIGLSLCLLRWETRSNCEINLGNSRCVELPNVLIFFRLKHTSDVWWCWGVVAKDKKCLRVLCNRWRISLWSCCPWSRRINERANQNRACKRLGVCVSWKLDRKD